VDRIADIELQLHIILIQENLKYHLKTKNLKFVPHSI